MTICMQETAETLIDESHIQLDWKRKDEDANGAMDGRTNQKGREWRFRKLGCEWMYLITCSPL